MRKFIQSKRQVLLLEESFAWGQNHIDLLCQGPLLGNLLMGILLLRVADLSPITLHQLGNFIERPPPDKLDFSTPPGNFFPQGAQRFVLKLSSERPHALWDPSPLVENVNEQNFTALRQGPVQRRVVSQAKVVTKPQQAFLHKPVILSR